MSQPAGASELAVALQRARVGVEVPVRRELQAVDEDARHHRAAARASLISEMASCRLPMVGTEGGVGLAGERGAQLGDAVTICMLWGVGLQ